MVLMAAVKVVVIEVVVLMAVEIVVGFQFRKLVEHKYCLLVEIVLLVQVVDIVGLLEVVVDIVDLVVVHLHCIDKIHYCNSIHLGNLVEFLDSLRLVAVRIVHLDLVVAHIVQVVRSIVLVGCWNLVRILRLLPYKNILFVDCNPNNFCNFLPIQVVDYRMGIFPVILALAILVIVYSPLFRLVQILFRKLDLVLAVPFAPNRLAVGSFVVRIQAI